jgi:ABC transporter ATM
MSKFCINYTINNLSVNSDLLLNLSYHKLTNVLRNQNKYNYNAFCNLSLYSIIKVQTSNHNNNAKKQLNINNEEIDKLKFHWHTQRFLSVSKNSKNFIQKAGIHETQEVLQKTPTITPFIKGNITKLSNELNKGNALVALDKKSASKIVLTPKALGLPEKKMTWQTRKEILKIFFQYIWPKDDLKVKLRVVFALCLLFASKILNVSVPYFFKFAIDKLNAKPIPGSKLLTMIYASLIGYGVARLGANASQEGRNAVFASVAQKAIRKAAKSIFFHLHNLDCNFHLTRQTGALTRAIDRGTKGINQVLHAIVFHIGPTLLEIVMVCCILIKRFGVAYAGVALTTIVAYTAFTLTTTKWRTKIRRRMNMADNQASAHATDSLINFEVVKSFCNEGFETKIYDKSLAKYEKAATQSMASLAFLNSGQNAIFSIALSVMMLMAANGVVGGVFTVGDIVMINSLIFQLSVPLHFLGSVYRETTQSLMDMDLMFRLKNIKTSVPEIENAKLLDLDRKGGEIRFENVTFGYNKERQPILNNISFTIPAGSRVAFVGSSGSGKSTILRLLQRFYDPQEGKIYIDDQDISEVKIRSLRSSFGIVPQDTPLFNQSIYYNIAYAKPDATPEEIYEAAKKAKIHDVIVNQFPEGYNTKVGQRGTMISGGEKQRVALARAILKNPRILLFDEATSALDTTTERSIMKNIDELLKESNNKMNLHHHTTIFIVHRLSTVVNCDEIFVIDNGTVAERGSHWDLLYKNGIYAKMWKAQQQTNSANPYLTSKGGKKTSNTTKDNDDETIDTTSESSSINIEPVNDRLETSSDTSSDAGSDATIVNDELSTTDVNSKNTAPSNTTADMKI